MPRGPARLRAEWTRITFLALAAMIAAGSARARPISEVDEFRIGRGEGACVAQTESREIRGTISFDRRYAILCPDAGGSVGELFVLHGDAAAAERKRQRRELAECQPAVALADRRLSRASSNDCRLLNGGATYEVISAAVGKRRYVAEGLAGYDNALRVGLRSLLADREIDEAVSIPSTASESAELARIRAEAADPSAAAAEGFQLNNDGRYAEAAEYFSVVARESPASDDAQKELLAAQALQLSNIGNLSEADDIFEQLDRTAISTPAVAQFVQNAHATHLLNAGRLDEALDRIRRNVGPARLAPTGGIDQAMANRLNASSVFSSLATDAAVPLPDSQRLIVLAAQRHQIEATILRLQGDRAAAEAQLALATSGLAGLSADQAFSAARLQSQVITEEAELASAEGAPAKAEQLYRQALQLLAASHPDTPAYFLAKARLARQLAGAGQTETALAMFRDIVRSSALQQAPVPALKEALRPYFRLLIASEGTGQSDAAAEMFLASQLILGPGVAQTQAVLARELSGGSGKAAQLFRRSLSAKREVERLTTELARMADARGSEAPVRLAELRAALRSAQEEQVAALAGLSVYPQYRAVASQPLELRELQAVLRPGEAYWKLSAVGQEVYAIFATRDRAEAYQLPIGLGQLNAEVSSLRDSISVVENGETVMYPFDTRLSHTLFETLAGPVKAAVLRMSHLIFEPDAEMSRLPVAVLVTEDPPATPDPFDFTKVQWLGRQVATTTSVSARGFKQIRETAPSRATHQYIGFGENSPAPDGASRERASTDWRCSWPLAAWSKPVSATELRVAKSVIGDTDARILTGDEFTDSNVKTLPDLGQYRIVHFATHGLTDAPRKGCSAQPALLTSIAADASSDGLLTFREIFELDLDADLVILSACNTASGTSKLATSEAGLRGGGEFPLDGLVRAFVGAGSRSVIATHWPVPDDYDATERLLSGMFRAPRGTSIADAIRLSQAALMNDKTTSHPFYWAAFIVVGDGAKPLLPKR